MKDWKPSWIALGSNLGDREEHIRSALRELEARANVRILAVSRIIETEPVGIEDQPDFLNAAAAIETCLPVKEFLALLIRIERSHGRKRSREDRWGARTLDLDLLLYNDCIIDEPGLTVPHPRLHERLFVLRPLAEIAGTVVHPILRTTITDLLRALENQS